MIRSSGWTQIRKLSSSYTFILLVVAILLFVAFGQLTETFWTARNLISMCKTLPFVGFIAIGWTVILVSGNFDMSPGSLLGLTSIVLGVLIAKGFGVGLSLSAALLLGVVIGLTNGLLTVKAKLSSLIVTLAMMMSLRGLCYVVLRMAAGGEQAQGVQSDFLFYLAAGKTPLLGLSPSFLIFVIFAIAVHFLLSQTKLGLHMYAVGGNEMASYVAGVNVDTVKIICFVIPGICAAMTGVITTGFTGAMSPYLGVGREFDGLAAAVLGGTSLFGGMGTVFGSVLGTVILTFIFTGMSCLGVETYTLYFLRGVAVLLAVAIGGRYTAYLKERAAR